MTGLRLRTVETATENISVWDLLTTVHQYHFLTCALVISLLAYCETVVVRSVLYLQMLRLMRTRTIMQLYVPRPHPLMSIMLIWWTAKRTATAQNPTWRVLRLFFPRTSVSCHIERNGKGKSLWNVWLRSDRKKWVVCICNDRFTALTSSLCLVL